MDKTANAYRTISEAAAELDLPQHVLRFWESRFPQIKPLKRGGGRRFYSPDDIELLRTIRSLLYGEGYTIKGVQRILGEQNLRQLLNASRAAREQSLPIVLHEPEPEPEPEPELDPGEVETPCFLAEQERIPEDAIAEATAAALPNDIRHKLEALLLELNECRSILAKPNEG